MSKESVFSVASQSEIKLDAVRKALNISQIVGFDSDSGINMQPIGMEEIVRGAQNRLKSARENGARGILYAIENGLIEIAPERFVDLAVIIIEDKLGNQGFAISKEVEVPIEVVKKMLAIGPDKTTFGKVLAEANPGMDHQDPHSFLTKGQTSRKQLLIDGLRLALLDLQVSQCHTESL